MWFLYALITTCAWGCADLFYKKGADERDKYSHLKTAMMVGFVMGIHAVFVLLTGDVGYNPVNIIKYIPVSAMYILSMTVGYFGLRYLALSISSPIQNSSGAVTCILCLIVLGQTMDSLSTVAVCLICGGVFLLGLLEKRQMGKPSTGDRKYTIGFVAFFMPILYCLIDSFGTFLDAYYLDDFATTPLVDVTEDTMENVANISYELTFLAIAVMIFIYLKLVRKESLTLFGRGKKETVADCAVSAADARSELIPVIGKSRSQRFRVIAALLETAGQATYVYAMSGNGVVAAPMIASYSIVSLILSRIFLKEKLTRSQYIAVCVVIAGIALLGIVEGLAE